MVCNCSALSATAPIKVAMRAPRTAILVNQEAPFAALGKAVD
jgi:hypothetical protein